MRLVARRTAAEACFIDIEARTLRIFDVIRRPFAIGHDGSEPASAIRARCSTRVIANYMNFLSEIEIWIGHWNLVTRSSKRQVPQRQKNVEPCVRASMVREMVGSRRPQHWW